MTEIIGGILAGPEVDEYHKVSNDFTTPQQVKYVNELTKLLTEIETTKNNPSLTSYLVKVKGAIENELAGINEGDEVVAKLVEDASGFNPSTLSDLLLEKFQVTTAQATEEQLSTELATPEEQESHTGNPPTSAQEQSTKEIYGLSGGFRKTNKRRNNKGRKRSKGTRKK